ncbi:MAG: phospholipid/cholesterol/gamma-HCH transport system substrate-binding protein [Actinomycetota bacterium]|jgi:phospholipid/cholesterol/gamma-HCH transport system substrate-binding protein|nr:phospholipid/cholesterol/gamma-HCH transport system substrate-binding protein [Actinomycetota bacterium]
MRSTGIKLATFTIFTIFVTFWLATVIGKLTPFASTYEVKAVFTDATGVLKGDPVKIAGVRVGKVTGFEVDEGEAILTFEINGEVDLPQNSMAEIRFLNLLGQRVVNILEPKSPDEVALEDGDTIPVENTRPALDLSVVFNNLRPLIQSTNPEDINTVARTVLDVFKGHEKDLSGILGNIGELATTLSDRDQRLARLVGDLDQVTKILNNQSDDISVSLDEFTQFMESLADMTPLIETTVDQLNEASQKFGGVVTRNQFNLNQELDDLATLLNIVESNLGPLDRIAKNLKEVLLATARTQGYGKWWNLYVVNLCPEVGAFGVPELPNSLDCER